MRYDGTGRIQSKKDYVLLNKKTYCAFAKDRLATSIPLFIVHVHTNRYFQAGYTGIVKNLSKTDVSVYPA